MEGRPPRVASDLTTPQLRHLLIAKLPATVGVEAWGADRETLLEIAQENGVHYLSMADIDEVGPADSMLNAAITEDITARRRARARKVQRHPSAGTQWKLYAQLMIIVIMTFIQSGRIPGVKQWLGLAPPPLPPCPPVRWWQHTLPFLKHKDCKRKV